LGDFSDDDYYNRELGEDFTPVNSYSAKKDCRAATVGATEVDKTMHGRCPPSITDHDGN
jgi:hypothetical protein